jgi:hypothetical protein
LQRVATLALLALLLIGTVAPALAAGVAGASAGSAGIADRQAQLHVEQPHYVDGDVRASSADGDRVYHVKGESLEIHPQNFDAEKVVDYGVESGGDSGQLSYDPQTGEFELSAGAEGSYEVYWIVSEGIAVENESPNASGNDSNTTTETRQVRYSAIIRVEGAVGMEHMQSGDLAETREDAGKWEEFNSSVSDLRGRSIWVTLGLQDPMTTEQLIQSMINAWLLVNEPIAALTGDSSILIVLFMSLTGIAFLGALAAYHTGVIVLLYRKLNIHETTEAAEGEVAERLAALDDEERRRRLAKRDFVDVFGDDHIADAFRDLGANPLEALENWVSRLRQRFAFHDRLQAMHQASYVAVVDDRAAADGGASEDGGDEAVPISARVVHEDDLAEDGPDDQDQAVQSLDVDVDAGLLDALDWAQPEIREFDFVGADFDRAECVTPIEEYDLKALLELSDLDMRNFSDEAAAGEYLRDLLADIREHPICDDQGRVKTLRYGLEQFLRSAALLEDRYELPIDYYVDLVDRAVDEHDAREQAVGTLRDVQEGKYA